VCTVVRSFRALWRRRWLGDRVGGGSSAQCQAERVAEDPVQGAEGEEKRRKDKAAAEAADAAPGDGAAAAPSAAAAGKKRARASQ
jgi:hypothetical protein